MKVFTYTHQGSRERNQDYIAYSQIGTGGSLYVLADGMGGYESGEIAAQLVAEAVLEYANAHFEHIPSDTLISEAFLYADVMLGEKRKEMEVDKMGAVVVAAYIHDGQVDVGWLGDSRFYLIRDGKEIFVSTDHSLINDLKNAGTYKEGDSERYASFVTRCIMGDGNPGESGTATLSIGDGDLLVLCSDGIHKEMDVAMLPSSDEDLQNQLDSLSSSLPDNLSIIRIQL